MSKALPQHKENTYRIVTRETVQVRITSMSEILLNHVFRRNWNKTCCYGRGGVVRKCKPQRVGREALHGDHRRLRVGGSNTELLQSGVGSRGMELHRVRGGSASKELHGVGSRLVVLWQSGRTDGNAFFTHSLRLLLLGASGGRNDGPDLSGIGLAKRADVLVAGRVLLAERWGSRTRLL